MSYKKETQQPPIRDPTEGLVQQLQVSFSSFFPLLVSPDETYTTFAVFTLAVAKNLLRRVVERNIFLGCLIYAYKTPSLVVDACPGTSLTDQSIDTSTNLLTTVTTIK